MGRITVSLPDPLEATLDAYAKEQKLSVSKVVTLALEAYFGSPSPPPDPAPPELAQIRGYLDQVVQQLDGLREGVYQMAIAESGPFAEIPQAISEPLPDPPWRQKSPLD
jgi:hypothetical protein